MTSDRRVQWLVAGHLVAASAAWGLIKLEASLLDGPWFLFGCSCPIPLAGVALGQGVLLGAWAGLSHKAIHTRLTGVVAGLAALEALLTTSFGTSLFRLEPVVLVAGAAVALQIECVRGVELVQASAVRGPRRRYSVCSLMWLVVFAALLFFAFRLYSQHYVLANMYEVAAALCVGLVMVRVVLGAGANCARVAGVFVLAIVLGFTVAYVWVDAAPWMYYVWKPATQVISAGVILSSLCVVRSCGYSLQRGPGPGAANGPAGVPFLESPGAERAVGAN